MKENEDIENRLRRLKPSPMPRDVKEKVSEEIAAFGSDRPRIVSIWSVAASLGIAAAVCLMIVFFPGTPGSPGPDEGEMPVSVLKKESTLLESRPVAILHHEGQTWELTEQKWRDDSVAYCSASPVRVETSEIRLEMVYLPVDFL